MNRALIVDEVQLWTHAALANSRALYVLPDATGGPAVRLSITSGLLLATALAQLVALHSSSPGRFVVMLAPLLALLVQELPRALVARASGRGSRVILSVTGGDTAVAGERLCGGAAVAFAVAGSVANLAAAAAAGLLSLHVSHPSSAALQTLAGCQAAWGLGQMLPLVPFRAGLTVARRLGLIARAVHAALSFVVLTALVAAVGSASWAATVMPILALAIWGCALHMGVACHAGHDERVGAPAIAAEAEEAVHCGDAARGVDLAERGIRLARSGQLRCRLTKTLAWAAVAKPDPFVAHRALARLPASELDLHLVAAYLSCCNRLDDAVGLLEAARARGHRARETTKLLIDVLARKGNATAALALARAEREQLSASEWEAVLAAVG